MTEKFPAPGDSAAAGPPIWRAMLDGIPDAALVLDSRQVVMAANRSASDLLPVRVGAHVAHTSRAPEWMVAIDDAASEGVAKPFKIHMSLPVDRHLSGMVTPLEGRAPFDGQPAMLVVFRDVGEQDRLAQMRSDFVANASHELRTPLTSLRGFIETLQGVAKDDPKARERFLQIMSEQAERMTRLIDDLLSLSRIEMRAHLPPGGRVDLNEAAGHVVKSLEQLARVAGIRLELRPLDQPALIRGDKDEIVQAIQNLLQNAIKYGRAGGTASVVITQEPNPGGGPPWLSVSIVDDGLGIAREHLPRLTERFYRVSAGASRDKGGTGLGLAIVKHIVLRHDGDLRIHSELGRGSTFVLQFKAMATGV